jgi:glycosyltransferase involved in cell wall biosynthesis
MISVCLASYNGDKYIKEQITSILHEIGAHDELLISDDGSTDRTLDIIERFDDSRIKLFRNSFKCHIRNFQFLLQNVSGDYIFLADQDDVWIEGKVAICLKHLQNYSLVLSDCFLVNGEMEIIKDSSFTSKTREGFWLNYYRNNFVGCCMAFRKELLIFVLPFPKEINSHDMWIGLVAELKGSVKIIPEKLIYFRRHGSNFSASLKEDTFLSGKSPYPMSKIIYQRAYMGFHLLKVFLRPIFKT